MADSALLDLLQILRDRIRAAGYAGQHLGDGTFGLQFVAHQPDRLRLGADEDEAAFLNLLGKFGVLGEQAVSRMDGFSVSHLRGGDDRRLVQVTLVNSRRTDTDGLVRESHIFCADIGLRVDGNRLDTKLPASALDSERNLTPIGDEQFLKHSPYSMTNKGSP